MLPICDRPDRIGARIYLALRYEPCGCCTFWRGVVLGAVVGSIITSGLLLAI